MLLFVCQILDRLLGCPEAMNSHVFVYRLHFTQDLAEHRSQELQGKKKEQLKFGNFAEKAFESAGHTFSWIYKAGADYHKLLQEGLLTTRMSQLIAVATIHARASEPI